MTWNCWVVGLGLCLMSTRSVADVKLPAIFSDHMVLQQGLENPFWGTADPGEAITVTLDGQAVSTQADPDGHWSLKAPAVREFGPVTVRVAGKNVIDYHDVLIGDVWIVSGQSNAEWSIENSGNPLPEIEAANYPEMRFVQIPKVPSTQPLSDSRNPWVEVTPDHVRGLTGRGGLFGQGGLSAMGYYFGRELHHRLQRPIGLIHCAWGGTVCEAWTSEETLKNDGEFSEILARAATANADPNQAANPNRASVLFNGMISPIRPYGIKGVIWYQGASNAGRAYQYRKLFPALITDWRKHWGQGDFPFLFTQLASFMPRQDQSSESHWAELREAQTMALSVPQTGMAVTVDLGDSLDIHPRNKQDFGKRLAANAFYMVYGQNVVPAGPRYRSMTVEKNKIRIQFHHVGGGLVSKNGPLVGFAICGVDRKFQWAEAELAGDSVLVSTPEIPEPIAVRYAWADHPRCNLYNKEGLPASPFRTDDFPGLTVNIK